MEDSNMMTSMSYSEEKNWALFSHLGVFAGIFIPFGNILTSLIIWQINKEKSEFITDHAIEALNFKISMMIIYFICGLLCIVLIGIPMIIAAFVVDVIFSIKGAIKASEGEYYDYPFNFRFIK